MTSHSFPRLGDRLGALSGASAMTLFVVGTVLVDPAPRPHANPSALAEQVARELADNAGAARAGAWCLLGGVFLLLVFLARLHGEVRAALPAGSWLPGLVPVAGATVAAVQLWSAALAFAVSEESAYRADPGLLKLLLVLGWNGASLLAPGLAALLLVGTWAAFLGARLPAWLAWAGAVLLSLLAIAAALGLAGTATLPGFLWLTLASLTLVVRRSDTPAARDTDSPEPAGSPDPRAADR